MASSAFKQDMSQLFAGAISVAADTAYKNLLERQDIERKALMQIAGTMSDNGTLDALPDDVWKKIQQKIGKSLGESLMYRSALRKKQLAPLRMIQQGVENYIGRDIKQLVPMQNRQVPIPQSNEPPPEGDLGLMDTTQRYRTERVPTGGPAIDLLGGQEQLQAMQANPQYAQLLQGYQVRSIPPTAQQQFLRTDQLSPLGVALLTRNNDLGTLAYQGLAQRVELQKLEFDRSKQAAKLDEPTFGTIQEIVTPTGQVRKMWPMYTQNGGLQMLDLAEAEQGDAVTRIIQQIQKVDRQLEQPNINDAKIKVLEDQRDKLMKAFTKLTSKTSIDISLNEGAKWVTDDPNTGRGHWELPPVGDKATARRIRNEFYENNYGGVKQKYEDRETMIMGNLALATLLRMQPLMTPENIGLLGRVQRFTIDQIRNMQNGPELLAAIQSFVQGQQPMLSTRITGKKPGAKARVMQELNAANVYDATLNTLAGIIAKFRDPNSTIREEEFNRIRKEIAGAGIASAASRLFTLEQEVRTRMLMAQQRINKADIAVREAIPEMGPRQYDPEKPDTAMDILYPEIYPGADPSKIPGAIPGISPAIPGQPPAPTQDVTRGNLNPQPPVINVPTPPQSTREIIQSEVARMGIQPGGLNPVQWNEIAAEVNAFLNNNPNLPDAAKAQAIRILVNKYITDRNLAPIHR